MQHPIAEIELTILIELSKYDLKCIECGTPAHDQYYEDRMK